VTGKFYPSFFNPASLADKETPTLYFSTRPNPVTELGTNIAPLLNSGTKDLLYCYVLMKYRLKKNSFVLMEMYQGQFPL
jgi:hypothetical protein